MKANEFVKKFGWDSVKKQIKQPTGIYGAAFDYAFMSDLKRLVESHELVERLGGLDAARNIFMYAGDGVHACRRVSQAIADVESCK